MNGMDLLKPIIDAANRNNAQADGDYLDDEGLLCCGKCHTRKQLVVPLPEGLRRTETETAMTVGVPCECRKKAIEREEQLERERKEMEAVAALKKQSLMDDRLADANFENFQQTKQNSRHLRLCRRYAECFNEMMEKNQGLLFYGGVGTGKTYAAACIANYLLNRRRSVVMTSFVKLLESMMNFKEDDSVLISRLNRCWHRSVSSITCWKRG